MRDSSIITLMTDFGDRDPYVGCMKGVILSTVPDARIVDITHQVPSFSMVSASYMLSTYYGMYPPGTVHVAVVDPGVGGPRAALAVAAGGHFFVLPDNGIITMVAEEHKEGFRARLIENPLLMRDERSATFHGRDIFAPAAAKLASGFPFDEVGPAILHPALIEGIVVSVGASTLTGAAVHIDHFGNYITNITAEHLSKYEGPPTLVKIGAFAIMGMSHTYSDKKNGELLAYVGSTGRLEIAVAGGSAKDVVGLPAGAEVVVRWRGAAG